MESKRQMMDAFTHFRGFSINMSILKSRFKESRNPVDIKFSVSLVGVPVYLRAGAVNYEQIALRASRSFIQLLRDVGRHPPVMRRRDEESGAVADSPYSIKRVEPGAVETSAPLDQIPKLIS
jgi:hypothetical protein